MTNKTTCKKVSAMLSLYIDNKISSQQKIFIENHLNNCKECYQKYLYLKSMIKDLKASYKQVLELTIKKEQHKMFLIREHEKFQKNVSAYIDNELDAKESYEFRKYLMKSKNAQNDLKNMYLMQKKLNKCFEETKNTTSPYVFKNIIKSIRAEKKQDHKNKTYQLAPKMFKIAILSGLILIGGYEFDQLYKQHKLESNQTLIQSVKKDFNSLKKEKKVNINYSQFTDLKTNQ